MLTTKKTTRKQAGENEPAKKKAARARSAAAGGIAAKSARSERGGPSKAKSKRRPHASEAAPAEAGQQPFPVVGVGASAGGLEAFTALLKALPPDSGMAFVLVQHMNPSHESMLVPLLAKATAMPLSQVEDGMAVEPNRVYVIAPNTTIGIRGGILRVVRRGKVGGRHMPVDDFLASLAEDRRDGAIGVVLSGTASDGTLGLKAIKAEGGITFAQDEETAKYPGMPHSAVQAGCVDFVLPPARIARELVRIRRNPYPRAWATVPDEAAAAVDERNRDKIYRLLRSNSGVDFRFYKPGTVIRRIHRRMALARVESLDEYVQYLEQYPREVRALFDDILIHVTSFFRDPEAFDTLTSLAFPAIQARQASGEPIRIWTPGCSSGEEVYSIMMALLEYLGEAAARTRIQMFGTDICERDIDKARAGVYQEAGMDGVSPARRKRFFVKIDGGYQIAKSIREMCVFARHDLIQNPPFSRLDLISCRNLLIYLSPAAHKTVLGLFHYALKPGGYLLLGKSETIGGLSHLFEAPDRKKRIYARQPGPAQRVFEMAAADYPRSATVDPKRAEATVPYDVQQEGNRILLERFAPPGFVVDEQLKIVHFQGDTSPFLKPAPGAATFQLPRIVRPELQLALKAALHKAKKRGEPVLTEAVEMEHNGRGKRYEIEVIPLAGRPDATGFLVLFGTPGPEANAGTPRTGGGSAQRKAKEAKDIERMRREVAESREYLRAVTEEQEASREELRVANEEMLSSNEELQSTNEELESAKEELQSTNEELGTLNEQLRQRNQELAVLTTDLNSLLTGVEIPIVILGEDLRIRRFTPPAETLLNLLPSDVGRPIGHIKPRIDVANLEELAAAVMATGRMAEREVRDLEGRWHSLRVKPHKTADNRIDGVLLALVDVTRMKDAELAALRDREATISALLESAAQGILAVDKNGRLKLVNSTMERLFGYSREELLGKDVEALLPERFRRAHAGYRGQFFAHPGTRPMGLGPELYGQKRDGTEFPIEVSLSHIESAEGSLAVGFVSDISQRRQSEKALREGEARLKAILDHTPAIVYLKDARGRYVLINSSYEQMLNRSSRDVEGKTPYALFARKQARRYAADTKEVLASGAARKFEQIIGEGGSARTFLCEEFPLYGPDREVHAVCGICSDITDRTRMEAEIRQNREALRALTKRLISTQEQQYGELARELHDDFTQRLAVMAIEMGEIKRLMPPAASELQARLGSIKENVKEFAESLHDLSRRLHPAVLEDLGLAVALKNECRAFADKYGIRAACRLLNLPQPLPDEVSLCLYRVVQESLLNAGKHSGAKHVTVSLAASREEIVLRIVDAGAGFNPEEVRAKGGLGLISMEERVRFQNGRLTIESQPGGGTQVEARIPLGRNGRAKKAKKR